MSDLLIKNCNLGDGQNTDILIQNGLIAEISDSLPQNGCPEIDAKNYFVKNKSRSYIQTSTVNKCLKLILSSIK